MAHAPRLESYHESAALRRIEPACNLLANPVGSFGGDEFCIHFSRRAYGCDMRREFRRNTPAGAEVRQNMRKTALRPLVTLVDDDESVRESLPDLLRELGYEPRVFSSAEEFLKSDYVDKTKCLLLDIAMPHMSGPDLQDELTRRQIRVPIVYITAQRDEAMRSRMLARGAADCLFKPFSDTALQRALSAALLIN